MDRYDPVYIEEDRPAFVRIHANTPDAYSCITANHGVIVFIAYVLGDELREGMAYLGDALDVFRQALAAEPAMVDNVVAHIQRMEVRREGLLAPVFDAVSLLRWVATIEPATATVIDMTPLAT